MEYVLQTYGLTKRYKDSAVVDHVSMNVRRGEIYGFVGRNGAGKTTVMRLVCGLISPSEGGYSLFGRRENDANILAARRRTGAIIETPSLYPDMTAYQNIKMQSIALGVSNDASLHSLLAYVGLENTGRKKARHFSLGMRQRLGIAMTLVGNPDFIILDEPVNGLDPQGIVEIRELLLRLNRDKGVTVLIFSHILSELSKLATCYGFIERGRLVRELTASELEAACRRSVRIEVSSVETLPYVLERGLGISDFKLLSGSEAEIYGDVNLGELAAALRAAGIDLYRSHEQDEDLEGYFLNLVGGDGKC